MRTTVQYYGLRLSNLIKETTLLTYIITLGVIGTVTTRSSQSFIGDAAIKKLCMLRSLLVLHTFRKRM